MADHIDTWHVEDDDTVSTRGVYRIVASSAYAAQREHRTTARPPYVATVYSAEAAREIAAAHNTATELAALRARVAELEAERAPKVRDESVPPPGWRLWWREGDYQIRENLNRADRAMRDAPDGIYTIAEAWRIYDAEHGYAPDIAAARADERARTEADIAAASREYAERARATAQSWDPSSTAEAKYHRGRARGADELAQRVGEGDYPKLPRGG